VIERNGGEAARSAKSVEDVPKSLHGRSYGTAEPEKGTFKGCFGV